MKAINFKKTEKSCCLNDNTTCVAYKKSNGFTGSLLNSELPSQLSEDFSRKSAKAIAQNRICEISFKGIAPQKAFESINFVRASTLEDAQKYALEVLGLQSVDYQGELTFANWTNEAFTALINRFKGRDYLPHSLDVKPYERNRADTLAIQIGGHITVFSRAIENSAVEGLDKLTKSWYLDPSQKGARNFLHALYPKEVVESIDKILTKYSQTGKTDLKSALIAYDFEKDFRKTFKEVCDYPGDSFAKLFKGLRERNMVKIIKDGDSYIVILNENYGKTEEEIQRASVILTEQVNRLMSNNPADYSQNITLLKIMGDVLGERGIYLSSIDSVEKMPKSFDIVFHECGHFAHEKYHPQKSDDIARNFYSYQAHFVHFRDKVKRLLTDRAALNPDEYLAEKFTFKTRGIEFDDTEIQELDEFLEAE